MLSFSDVGGAGVSVKDSFLRLMDKLQVSFTQMLFLWPTFGSGPFVLLRGVFIIYALMGTQGFGVRDIFSKWDFSHSATGQG